MGDRAHAERASHQPGFRSTPEPRLARPSRLAATPGHAPDPECGAPDRASASLRLAVPLVVAVVLAVGLSGEQPAGVPEAQASGDAHLEDPWLADQMLALLNDERTRNGLPRLELAAEAGEVAARRSLDMAVSGTLSHYSTGGTGPVELLNQLGVPYMAMGENIARSSYPAPEVVSVVHAQLMASEYHRRNALNPAFGRVGIAIASSNGVYYFSLVFLD